MLTLLTIAILTLALMQGLYWGMRLADWLGYTRHYTPIDVLEVDGYEILKEKKKNTTSYHPERRKL